MIRRTRRTKIRRMRKDRECAFTEQCGDDFKPVSSDSPHWMVRLIR